MCIHLSEPFYTFRRNCNYYLAVHKTLALSWLFNALRIHVFFVLAFTNSTSSMISYCFPSSTSAQTCQLKELREFLRKHTYAILGCLLFPSSERGDICKISTKKVVVGLKVGTKCQCCVHVEKMLVCSHFHDKLPNNFRNRTRAKRTHFMLHIYLKLSTVTKILLLFSSLGC